VIILSDLVLSDASFERSLFYTGVTRATESVLILCHESSRATLARWLSL
jgi:ATP-dependent exoDNAse (exonuclease V) alpha subunit